MQVFLSDIHLTDGTSGTTISANAFNLLYQNLKKLLEDVQDATELKIVLLGDIFDVIRSTQWLNTTVRPWDSSGEDQKKVVGDIVRGILNHNCQSIEWIRKLQTLSQKFELQYVIGNHDWLLNRYPDIAKNVAAELHAAPPNPVFPAEIFAPAYNTIARHGDIYDPLNFMGDRNKSSIGDAIVIELLNRFPIEVAKRLSHQQAVVDRLKEIDNVRPLLDVPSWVLMASNRESEVVGRAITDAWQCCVDDFFKIQFIKDMNIPFWPDIVDELKVALQLSSHTSKWMLEKLIALKNRFFHDRPDGGYLAHAWAESKICSGQAKYALYGHTHDHLMIPMGLAPAHGGGIEDKVYFNTGTWRQTWNKTACDSGRREFVGWKVLTYIAFYNKDENDDYEFEVWNGALG
jgi:UDP-2,3-diacylglucosamine pyrophosphatase LpxH